MAPESEAFCGSVANTLLGAGSPVAQRIAPQTVAPVIARCDSDAGRTCATCAEGIRGQDPVGFLPEPSPDLTPLLVLVVCFLRGLCFSLLSVITDETLQRADRKCWTFLTAGY